MRPITLNRTVLLSLALFVARAHAHDFWVEPNSYRVAEAAPVGLTLQVGHGPFRQRSPVPVRRIIRFSWVAPDATIADLRGSLRLGEPDADAELVFPRPGTFIVALETDNRAQSHLPSLRFNDYLRVEGLAAAFQQRERTHRMDTDGSEIYSRHSKALIQVGSSADHSGRVTQPLGMPLEIIPDINPYDVPMATTLPIHVLFAARPLAGALVKLTNLDHDSEPVEIHLTDVSGRASFVIPGHGKWLLNVIWTEPRPASAETEFETYFSSLSFGR
jgi:uncharacterized GH25 family protein